MRRWVGLLLFAVPLWAQPAPAGLLRGTLLECQITGDSGEFSVRTVDNQVLRFQFDAKTYFEREQERASAKRLEKGDMLEVVSDHAPGHALAYARTVHVVEAKAAPRAQRLITRRTADRSSLEQLFPRGDLTLSGIVDRLNGERLVLRTRADGEKIILLRQDTRYLSGGSPVDAASLQPNTRVFVRAGKNLDNEIEAYQVVWGEILKPR